MSKSAFESQTPPGSFLHTLFHRALDSSPVARTPYMQVWLGVTSPIVEVFCWLVVVNKMTFRREGMVPEDFSDVHYCEELINQYVVHCDLSSFKVISSIAVV